MQTSLALLSVLAVLAAIASAQDDCPDEVRCVVNPCDTARCPRFLDAECRPDNCNGQCTATFFRGRNNRKNVTDRCPAPTCETRECPSTRICVEDTVPAECPQDNLRCRQYINTRCVFPNCSQLSCDLGDICIVRNEISRCIDPERIEECRERNCEDRGLECRQVLFASGLELFVCATPLRCTPARVQFCAQFSNQSCEEFNGTSICTFTCERLNCERAGRECVRSQNGGFTCERPTTCTNLFTSFCQRNGQECVIDSDGDAVCEIPATCTPARIEFCGQFRLGCEERNGTTACVITCDTLQCETFGLRCIVTDSGPECVPPTSCDTVECAPGSNCFEFVVMGQPERVATCVVGLGETCEDLNCTDNDTCLFSVFPSRNFDLAQCFPDTPFPPPKDLNNCASQTCGSDEICIDLVQRGTIVSFFCATTGCNEGPACDQPDSVCSVDPLLGPIGEDGVCVPESVSYNSSINDCVNRPECFNSSTGGICNTVELDGVTVGTICSFEVGITASSCQRLDALGGCDDGNECVESTINDNTLASCTNSTVLDQSLAPFGV